MNRKKDPVREELARAGEASQITPSLRKLDGCRIMTDTDVPEEDFLMRFNGKACFPRRDLTAITGQEKCGKTFFTSMLMGDCAQLSQEELKRRVMELSHIELPKYYGKVFDLAVEKRVVCTTLNKGGRVVVISPPS